MTEKERENATHQSAMQEACEITTGLGGNAVCIMPPWRRSTLLAPDKILLGIACVHLSQSPSDRVYAPGLELANVRTGCPTKWHARARFMGPKQE
jgi:hypothetical protein